MISPGASVDGSVPVDNLVGTVDVSVSLRSVIKQIIHDILTFLLID